MTYRETTVGWKIGQVRFLESGEVVVNFEDDAPPVRVSYTDWSELALPRDELLSEEQHRHLQEVTHRWRVREQALRLLSSRDHSVDELRQKLRQRFRERSLIEACLQELVGRGLLSDERFARHFIESRLSSRDHGPYRLLGELRQRGVSRELAESVLSQYDDAALWHEKAARLLDKMLRKSKPGARENLWQKLYQHGFPREVIDRVLDELPELPENSSR